MRQAINTRDYLEKQDKKIVFYCKFTKLDMDDNI